MKSQGAGGYEAGELEREVAQLRAEMAAFESSGDAFPGVHLFEVVVADNELAEPKDSASF